MRHVDPEAVHAAVGPEPQRGQEVVAHLAVVPVQVRLLRREQVQVPLPVRRPASRPSRRRATPSPMGGCGPVRRRCRPGRCSDPVPASPCGAASASRNQACRSEVWLGTMSTITLMPRRVQRATISSKSAERAEPGVDVAVVVHVVAAVGQRRGVERAQPYRVHPERSQVRDPRRDAAQVADAVTVGVGEAARVDLVDHRLAPPVGVGSPQHVPPGGQSGELAHMRPTSPYLMAPRVTPDMTQRWANR